MAALDPRQYRAQTSAGRSSFGPPAQGQATSSPRRRRSREKANVKTRIPALLRACGFPRWRLSALFEAARAGQQVVLTDFFAFLGGASNDGIFGNHAIVVEHIAVNRARN